MGKIIIIMLIWVATSYARDPDVLPRDYGYGEYPTVGGSKWSGGDIFLAIALPIAVAMVIVLPHIFDGEDQEWPVHKFRLHLLSNVNKFPTRILCGSY